MAGQKFTLTFDAQLNVSQMNGALKQIQSTLNGLHLPQNITRGLQGNIDKLQKEITSFESLASKDIASKADMSKLESQAQKVSEAFAQLRRSFANLTGLSGKDLEKLFPSSISTNITNSQKALVNYTKSLNDATSAVKAQKTQVDDLKQSITDLQNKKTYTNTEWKQLQNDIKAVEAELENYKKLKKDAAQTVADKEAQLPNTYKNSKIWRDAVKDVQKYQQEIDNTQKKLDALNQAKVTGIKQEDQIKGLQKLNAELTVEQQKLQQLLQILQQLSSKNQGGGFQQLVEQVGKLTGLDMSQFKQTTEGVGEAIRVYLNQQLQQLGTNLNNAANSVNNTSRVFSDNRQQVHECAEAYQQFNTQAREVEQLKSRIQYFFSLNNAILLVKRTLREAYQTIKELDKAMTETAVVTDFSVGDMWAQLPDYTARANELGVTTKAAYEAATLFYQQGLKTNEVMAMSNETLKMARIAGLDAAVATDRMTNAIRGFNMEINETNAQRIDDVYSRLAAISASNVDEISTAMTKVASLAHNANMEFETTAAFLAQIIETTRESAETAGTALKTVVARFSEVKKLVDEGELSGKDEEGELIDVNKVSQALRTAGIDLNKYFLGEVGLDDIFMELASKWESLTTIQQRYIATQAAGSRQQSRFIALMSDYARTQELVGEAYNANGASAKQFAKTQESLESKLARLKNAWNEFAMGILNSDLVKAGVDLLTNILNSVNALTSGFGQLNEGIGGVINSVSKLLMLFGGLGLGKTLLGGITASISNIGLIAAGKAPLNVAKAMATSAVGANATGAMAGLAARGAGGAMMAGFLNPFAGVGMAAKGIGQTIWGGLQTRGLRYGAMGAASSLAGKAYSGLTAAGVSGEAALGLSGIASLAPALLGVAAAAGAVVAAYKLWEKYTPEGQLKTAKKIAEANQKIADDTQAEADSLKNLQSSYDEYTKAVNEATSVDEREKAIQTRNDAILRALDENADYSRFLETSFDEVTGELVLTLNSDAVTEAATEAAAAATAAAIDAYFSHADVSLKEAETTLKDLNAAKASAEVLKQMNDSNYSMNSEFYGGAAIDRKYVEEHGSEAAIAKLEAEWLAATQAAQKQAQLAYAKMIELANQDQLLSLDEKVGQGTSQALAEILGKIFIETGESLSQATVQELANGLRDNSLDSNILSAAVADALEFSLSDIDLDSEEGFQNYLEQLNISSDSLSDFASIVGIGEDVLRKYIKTQAKAIKEVQTSQRAKIYEQAFQNGIDITKELQNAVQALNSEELESVNNLLNSAQGLLGKDNEGFASLFADLPDLIKSNDVDTVFHLFNSVNLENPIQAFHKLNEISQTATGTLKKYADQLLELNKENFSTSNLVKSFMMTEEYTDELTKDIEKFIDENGRISAKNVEELADSSSTLRTILDDNIVSAEALADAINAINEGASIEGLTDELFEAFDAVADVDDMIWQLHDTIANFDAGLDYSEGTEFIVDLGDQLNELLENFEIGNQQTQRIYDQLFGQGAYEAAWNAFKAQVESGEATIEDFVNDTMARVTRVQEWAREESYNFMHEMAQRGELGITFDGTSENGDQFKWDVGDLTTEQLVQKVREAAGRAGQEISDTTAMALIEGAMAHMPDLRTELKENDFSASVEELVKEHVKSAKDISQSEMEALAKSVGKDVEEVRKAIEEAAKKNPDVNFEIKPIVSWVNEDGSPLEIDKVVERFEEQFGDMDVALAMHVHGKEVDYTALYNDLIERGMTPEQANGVADKLVSQIDQGLLMKKITIPNIEIDDNGNVVNRPIEVPVYADTVEGLEAAAKAKLEAAEQNADYTIMSQQLANQDFQALGDSVLKYLKWAADEFGTYLDGILDGKLPEGEGAGTGSGTGSEVQVPVVATPDEGSVSEATDALQAKANEKPVSQTVRVDYSYDTVNETNGVVSPDSTEVKVVTSVDEVSAAKLQEWVSQVGKVTLTFANEAEAQAEAERIKGEIAQDNIKLKLSTDLIENPDETYSIEVKPKGLIENIRANSNLFDEDPLKINSTAQITDIQQPEEPGVVETEAAIEDIDTTEADSKIQESAENAESQLSEKTEQGYTEGASQGAEVAMSYNEQVANDLAEKILNGEITSGTQGAAYISQQVDDQASAMEIGNIVYEKLYAAGGNAAWAMADEIQSALSNIVFKINVIAEVQGSGTVSGNEIAFHGGVVGSGSSAAKGGIVSLAGGSGSRYLQPGFALTGEEAPEIVWNKEKGYAYITGAHGPEFQYLNPGDQVFNAQETSRILENSKGFNELFGSFATGGWNRTKIQERAAAREKKSKSGSSGSKESSEKEKTPTVWENELDWLYNLVEDIDELEREQKRLAEQHDRYLNDISKTGRDLYNTTKEQLSNLYTKRDNERERLRRRHQEMDEQIGTSGLGQYVSYNSKDNTLEIDWDAIEGIQDKETYEEVTKLLSRCEKIQDEIEKAEDSLYDIEGQISDIEKRYLTEFTQFQQRVYDAVVNSYQQQIDKLQSLNDELNDTNAAVLDSLQKEIDYSRQIRDNTETRNELAQMEARLAYLQRDTTGANSQEIRELQKQIEASRQNYEDTLIDQEIKRLQDENSNASEQRAQQIELMTAQLDYWKETGELWKEVAQLMSTGMSSSGSIIRGSDLEMVLRDAEGWKAMSQQQREVWANDLITSANQAGAYLLKISEGLGSISKGVWAMIPASSVTSQKLDYGKDGYSTGGLNAHTGFAMLHGTPNEPEYVLNARQTDAFLRLSEVLPAMLGTDSGVTNTFGGNVFNLTMNVDSIASDYDVDRLVERVKIDLYEASSYRNVNSIGFIR